jgi:hypothetical protein
MLAEDVPMLDMVQVRWSTRRVVLALVLVLAALAAVTTVQRAEAEAAGAAAPVWSPGGQCFRSRDATPEEAADHGVPPGTTGAHAFVLWAGPEDTGYYHPGCVPPGYVYNGWWQQADSPYRMVDCTDDVESGCFWYVTGLHSFEWSRKVFVADIEFVHPGAGGGGGGTPDECPRPQAPAAGVRVVSEAANRSLRTIHLGDRLIRDYDAGAASSDLREAGARRGFDVSSVSAGTPTLVQENTWIEDMLVPLSDDSFLVPGDLHRDAARDATEAAGFGVFRAGQYTAGVMAMAAANGLQVRESTVFVEGGNLLTMRDAEGRPLVVVGRSSLYVAGFQRQMQGCLAADAGVEQMLEHARTVLAIELGVAASQVVDVADGGGHIDMIMRPAQDGVVLVDDPQKVVEAVRTAQADPGLPARERELLDRYAPDLDQRATRWTDVMRGASSDLERAGMRVVPVPGVMPGDRFPHPGVNFMNGVMATDDKGGVFYLTNTTKVTEPAGSMASLERAFQAAVAPLGVEVEFVTTGYLIGRGGGLDCVTAERAVDPAW